MKIQRKGTDFSEATNSPSQFTIYFPGSSVNHYFVVCYTDKSQIIKKEYLNEKREGKKQNENLLCLG